MTNCSSFWLSNYVNIKKFPKMYQRHSQVPQCTWKCRVQKNVDDSLFLLWHPLDDNFPRNKENRTCEVKYAENDFLKIKLLWLHNFFLSKTSRRNLSSRSFAEVVMKPFILRCAILFTNKNETCQKLWKISNIKAWFCCFCLLEISKFALKNFKRIYLKDKKAVLESVMCF